MKVYIITEEMFGKLEKYFNNVTKATRIKDDETVYKNISLIATLLDIVKRQAEKEEDLKKSKVTGYRLKHIPTGLYYKPGSVHLNNRGKIFNYKPRLN